MRDLNLPLLSPSTPRGQIRIQYPITLRENTRSGLDFAALDEICARANQAPVELPTGIGFCMAIKRTCISDIGGFNAAQFGLGYGEENDFCRRAAQKTG